MYIYIYIYIYIHTCVDTAKKIQKRAVSILIHLAAENEGKLDTGGRKVRKMAAIPVGSLALSSKHSLVVLGSSWHCSKCLEHRHCDSPVLAEWFATDCTPFVGAAFARRIGLSRPCSLPDGASVYAGRHLLHQSHVMVVFRGLYYCKHCGYYASSAPERLKAPCGKHPVEVCLHRGRPWLPGSRGVNFLLGWGPGPLRRLVVHPISLNFKLWTE